VKTARAEALAEGEAADDTAACGVPAVAVGPVVPHAPTISTSRGAAIPRLSPLTLLPPRV
jgi:hypothetical protein